MVQASSHKNSVTVITYGMGVYWAKAAAKGIEDQVEIIDLRSLNPIDYPAIQASVEKNGKCLLVTEEPTENGFMQALGGWIAEHCFTALDAPVKTVGSVGTPAIPLNSILEQEYLPNPEKVKSALNSLLNF